MLRRAAVAASLLGLMVALIAASPAGAAGSTRVVRIGEFKLSDSRAAALRNDWANRILARYPAGSWAPAKMTLNDRDLALMGLPSKRVLLSHRYSVPTALYPSGKMVPLRGASAKPSGGKGGGSGGGTAPAATPTVTTFAGTGYFGIRPGAWLLIVTSKEITLCSMAHVYGSPGAYQISTAGHCGKTGDIASVIGVLGNRADVPVLSRLRQVREVDWGQRDRPRLGADLDLSPVPEPGQPDHARLGRAHRDVHVPGRGRQRLAPHGQGSHLGPRGQPRSQLVQGIVHYGHGAGIGTGGTPRAGPPSRGEATTSRSSARSRRVTRGRPPTRWAATTWATSGRPRGSTRTSTSTRR